MTFLRLRYSWWASIGLLAGGAALIGPAVAHAQTLDAENTTGLRRLSHSEVVDLVADATVLFASNGEVVYEYHGPFNQGMARTAYRDWNQKVIEGRLELREETPGLVCYHYTGSYDNCAYFIFDATNGRTYLEFITTVQQQTVQTLQGDRLSLLERVQIPYQGPPAKPDA